MSPWIYWKALAWTTVAFVPLMVYGTVREAVGWVKEKLDA